MIYIGDAVRTPRGRGNDKGSLKSVPPVELLSGLARALLQKHTLTEISEAFIGCVSQTKEQGGNIGRTALLQAGLSDRCSALTLNRFCTSSLSAVGIAASRAEREDALTLAGGVEMFSRVPLGADESFDAELWKALGLVSIGQAADMIAQQEGYSRQECDAYALRSQQRAAAAIEEHRFASVVAVDGKLTKDECVRPSTTAESLSKMPSAFGGLHTAGNAPATADGASLVLLGTEGALRNANVEARAKILAVADTGSDRTIALTGAVDASQKALARAGLRASDIDLFEVNEAFAATMLHYQARMGVDGDRFNVNGGAIALGHPMGATGAMLLGCALDELERRHLRRALVAVCGGAGLATALVIER